MSCPLGHGHTKKESESRARSARNGASTGGMHRCARCARMAHFCFKSLFLRHCKQKRNSTTTTKLCFASNEKERKIEQGPLEDSIGLPQYVHSTSTGNMTTRQSKQNGAKFLFVLRSSSYSRCFFFLLFFHALFLFYISSSCTLNWLVYAARTPCTPEKRHYDMVQ